TANEADGNPGNNTGTATTTVNAAVDLAVTKNHYPDAVRTGQNLTYTVTVTNAGPDSATGVTLTDALPAGTTFGSATASQGTATRAAGTVTANLGTLANGASATVTIVAQAPSAGGTVTKTASVTSTEADTNPANNTASQTTTVSAAVDLAVS